MPQALTPQPHPPQPLSSAEFVFRHIGPRPDEIHAMLGTLGLASLDALTRATVPADIRLDRPLHLPAPCTEAEALRRLRALADSNRVHRSFMGMGYSECLTPSVIQRNILENPGWYTQYTPYQAEISQGRLEGLLNFQTLVAELTGLDVANASMLDESTAAAEAMMMFHRLKQGEGRNCFLIADDCHPQTIEVVQTRARALGIETRVEATGAMPFGPDVFGVLLQYPNTYGAIHDYAPLAQHAHLSGALVAVAADLLALAILKPPGEFGADAAIGSAQRFGVPLSFGGPHAAFFATRDTFKRQLPGRLVGVSKDSRGKPALRLSLGTREQHIRREKATSNICTAQALLANMASAYAVYHGPEGLRGIALELRSLAQALAEGARQLGLRVEGCPRFDTVRIEHPDAAAVLRRAADAQCNLRLIHTGSLGISLGEGTTPSDLETLLGVLHGESRLPFQIQELVKRARSENPWPESLVRQSPFLTHPVFHRHRSETEMLRYLKRLEARDLSMTTSMIPLGSCTMKLNATTEMMPVTWPGFSQLHPFAPADQTRGYRELFENLSAWLSEITGFPAISLQPNAGSQGEYAGLLAVREWHRNRGEPHRTVCLIPLSAHGTNPASAVMAGFRVVPVACDVQGNIDLLDLRAKAGQHAAQLGAIMVTYPSTHGVFETTMRELCEIVHQHGGQVYLDGANLNAQVGLCRPADMGADVCHLNLHKTFCIPHGGGGPGMGPIGVARHLAPFLPGHTVVAPDEMARGGAVSAAPWGSASLLPISWSYIAMMGAEGLRQATQVAILNANYIAHRLKDHFPVLYAGPGGWVAHECILDLRPFKSVTVEDVAKRLMDYGFHAPTISWPVAGTMMIEPTESEPREELDRFCDSLIAIRAEIEEIETGKSDPADNVLKNAPHTADMIAAETWNHPYSRMRAAYPKPWLLEFKYWPPVGRVDNVFGDRNLVCTCAGMEAYGA
ncbi:MAG: aminomethyl-transferring glycine dehydrogenase [Verrucomicrobia bacterium]|nr:aminomethyl-transferring glycine dehydrogenase [Verrucomicrobiota bacterium]